MTSQRTDCGTHRGRLALFASSRRHIDQMRGCTSTRCS
jgi:hypothetical protein